MIILGEWQGSTELGLIKDSSKISSLSTGKSPPSSSSTPLSSNSNNYIKLESWLKLSQSPPGSHSQHKSPLPKDDSDSSDSDNHNKLIFIGIGAVVGLLLFLMLVLLICLCKRKRRRRARDQMGLYMENSYEFNGNDYNSNEQGGNWNNNNYNVGSKDHVVKIPPPTNSHGVSLEYNWPIAPPPPPPMMSSNNFSSTQEQKSPNVLPIISSGFINQKNYTYDELATATGGFSKSNLLGEGGFGYVHKGILPNGKEVAVKSLKSKGGQEEREFQAEVETISRVNHRHLVSLLGYCISGSKRLLVYEFIPNNTLEYHLHGSGNPVMDFSTRLKIAIGTAKGFAYIHEDCHPRIIHRDIKGANILLDNNFEAKVADFGLAKLAADNFTHVSTRIMGTFGYLAPEYASTGKLTERSDVYSYGVMLLELITGLLPTDVNSDGENLVDWATPILNHATEGGNYDELIDPLLEGKFDRQQMFSMVTCAAASIRHSAKRRPKMSQIVHTLEGDVSLLNDLNKAATSGLSGSGESSECEGASNIKKLKRSETSSEEFTSS